MGNRKLTSEERDKIFKPLFKRVVFLLKRASNSDEGLLWALRRKLGKEIIYLERGKPMKRRALKLLKWREQNGKCLKCMKRLPESGSVLDRLTAMLGYTQENTRLLCLKCDTKIQRMRKFQ